MSPSLEYINIDGQNIRYEKSGQGQPVILMHGWGCNLTTVRSIAAIVSRNYAVYNIDLPGFGESEEPQRICGVEEYTALIEKFVKKIGITNPILIGHSFGGRVSILFASRNPAKKVILIDAAGIKPRRPLKYYLRIYSFKFAKFAVKCFFSKQKSEEMVSRMRSRKGSADYNSASPRMKAILSKVVNEDLKSVMPAISAPTLLVWGVNDTATPLSDAKTMERLIPDAGLVAFENAGHYSFLDNPFGFKRVIESFLDIK